MKLFPQAGMILSRSCAVNGTRSPLETTCARLALVSSGRMMLRFLHNSSGHSNTTQKVQVMDYADGITTCIVRSCQGAKCLTLVVAWESARSLLPRWARG